MLYFITPGPDLDLDWWGFQALQKWQGRCHSVGQFWHVLYLACEVLWISFKPKPLGSLMPIVLIWFSILLKTNKQNFSPDDHTFKYLLLVDRYRETKYGCELTIQWWSCESLDGFVSCKFPADPALAVQQRWPSSKVNLKRVWTPAAAR